VHSAHECQKRCREPFTTTIPDTFWGINNDDTLLENSFVVPAVVLADVPAAQRAPAFPAPPLAHIGDERLEIRAQVRGCK
jgi:hypothetical protein